MASLACMMVTPISCKYHGFICSASKAYFLSTCSPSTNLNGNSNFSLSYSTSFDWLALPHSLSRIGRHHHLSWPAFLGSPCWRLVCPCAPAYSSSATFSCWDNIFEVQQQLRISSCGAAANELHGELLHQSYSNPITTVRIHADIIHNHGGLAIMLLLYSNHV